MQTFSHKEGAYCVFALRSLQCTLIRSHFDESSFERNKKHHTCAVTKRKKRKIKSCKTMTADCRVHWNTKSIQPTIHKQNRIMETFKKLIVIEYIKCEMGEYEEGKINKCTKEINLMKSSIQFHIELCVCVWCTQTRESSSVCSFTWNMLVLDGAWIQLNENIENWILNTKYWRAHPWLCNYFVYFACLPPNHTVKAQIVRF